MAAGGGDYLPPVIAELIADADKFMAGLAQAKAELEEFAKTETDAKLGVDSSRLQPDLFAAFGGAQAIADQMPVQMPVQMDMGGLLADATALKLAAEEVFQAPPVSMPISIPIDLETAALLAQLTELRAAADAILAGVGIEGDSSALMARITEAKLMLADLVAHPAQVDITGDLANLASDIAIGEQMLDRIRDNPVGFTVDQADWQAQLLGLQEMAKGLNIGVKVDRAQWAAELLGLKAEVESQHFQVPVMVDYQRLLAQGPIEIPIEPDTESMFLALQKTKTFFNDNSIPVKVDTDQAIAELGALRAEHFEVPLDPKVDPESLFMALQATKTFFGDSNIPIRVDTDQAIAELGALKAATHFEIPAEIKVDKAGFLVQVAAMAAAASLMLSGIGGRGGGGLGTALGAGAGVFGLAGFGTVLGMAGLSLERFVTTSLGLLGSLAGAFAGLGVMAAGSLAVMAVGMGVDMMVMSSTIADTQTLGKLYAAQQQAIQQFGPTSTQAAAATAALNEQMKLLGNTAGVQAELGVAKLAHTLNQQWDMATSNARVQAANLMTQVLLVAQQYVPLVAAAAGANLSVINADLKPLFDWLKGPQGMGIFNDLESMFQVQLPIALDAFTNGIEILLKLLDYAAHFTGGFMQSIDALFKKWNTPDGINKMEGDIDKLIGIWKVWWGFIKILGRDLFDILSLTVGLGTSVIQTLTQMLDKLHHWIDSTSGQNQLHNLFEAHRQELIAILQLLPALAPMAQLYIAVATPIAQIVSGLAQMISWMLKIPVAGPILGWAIALGILGSRLGAFAALGTAVAVIRDMAVAIKSLGIAIEIANGAVASRGLITFFQVLAETGGPLAGLSSVLPAILSPVGLLVSGVAAAVGLAVALWLNWDRLAKIWGPLPVIISHLLGPLGALVAGIKLNQGELLHWLSVIQTFVKQVPAEFDHLLSSIGGFFSHLGSMVSKGWAAFASDPAYWIGWLLGFVAGSLVRLLSNFMVWIGSWLGQADHWKNQMILRGAAAVGGFVGAIGERLIRLPGDIANWLGQTLPKVLAWGRQMANEIISGHALQGLLDAIQKAIAGLPGEFFNVGMAMVRGLINGINSLFPWALQQLNNFLSGLISGAKASQKSSPASGRWAEEVGRPIPRGIALGIQQEQGAVLTALANLNRAMMGSRIGPLGAPSLALASAGGMGATTISVPITVNVSGAQTGTPQGVGMAVQQAVEREMWKLVRQLRGGTYMLPGHQSG